MIGKLPFPKIVPGCRIKISGEFAQQINDEIERLRAALKRIRDLKATPEALYTLDRARDLASNALGSEKRTEGEK